MCRSFVSQYFDEHGIEKFTGRFNMGVTSINAAFAAISSSNKEEFFEQLDELCDLAFEANMFRINKFKHTKAKTNPILWVDGALARLNPEDSIEPLIYGGRATSSIGYVGIAEAQEILGDTSKSFGQEILQYIKNKTDSYTKETNIAFSPYGSPAESTAYRFMTRIQQAFPEYQYKRPY
jgi:ribonucleoside-triphosphate reductase